MWVIELDKRGAMVVIISHYFTRFIKDLVFWGGLRYYIFTVCALRIGAISKMVGNPLQLLLF